MSKLCRIAVLFVLCAAAVFVGSQLSLGRDGLWATSENCPGVHCWQFAGESEACPGDLCVGEDIFEIFKTCMERDGWSCYTPPEIVNHWCQGTCNLSGKECEWAIVTCELDATGPFGGN